MGLAVVFLLSGAVAALGWRAGWLTAPAAGTGVLVGTATGWGGGVPALSLLGAFFLTGSVLSARNNAGPSRTARQVAANGWTAACGGLLLRPVPDLGWAVLAGGLAAALADTWSTEIGRRSRTAPVLITTGRPVPAGTSGGITWLGTLGGAAGALGFAALGWALRLDAGLALWLAPAGICGMLVDSLLGATLQARFRCHSCGRELEAPEHAGCPASAGRARGVAWLRNDAVNALGSGVGAVVAALGVMAA
jgi:uncharacterized protein (TIGR00297 family)